jgi:hypothetical protein
MRWGIEITWIGNVVNFNLLGFMFVYWEIFDKLIFLISECHKIKLIKLIIIKFVLESWIYFLSFIFVKEKSNNELRTKKFVRNDKIYALVANDNKEQDKKYTNWKESRSK